MECIFIIGNNIQIEHEQNNKNFDDQFQAEYDKIMESFEFMIDYISSDINVQLNGEDVIANDAKKYDTAKQTFEMYRENILSQ